MFLHWPESCPYDEHRWRLWARGWPENVQWLLRYRTILPSPRQRVPTNVPSPSLVDWIYSNSTVGSASYSCIIWWMLTKCGESTLNTCHRHTMLCSQRPRCGLEVGGGISNRVTSLYQVQCNGGCIVKHQLKKWHNYQYTELDYDNNAVILAMSPLTTRPLWSLSECIITSLIAIYMFCGRKSRIWMRVT